MPQDMVEQIFSFMRQNAAWSAPILFVVMAMEGVVLTTFIFSGTLMILAAGAMIQAGVLDYRSVFAAIFLGTWLGDLISFELGRRGDVWFRNLGVVRKRPDLLARGENLLGRWGMAAIFITRFMGPVRPFVTFLAGTFHMRPAGFHLATVLSTLIMTWGLLNAGMTGVQLWTGR